MGGLCVAFEIARQFAQQLIGHAADKMKLDVFDLPADVAVAQRPDRSLLDTGNAHVIAVGDKQRQQMAFEVIHVGHGTVILDLTQSSPNQPGGRGA